MATSDAERRAQDRARQKRRREKLLAAEAERDRLAAELERATEYIAELETQLEAERSGRHRCHTHGTELACPQCHREGGWQSA